MAVILPEKKKKEMRMRRLSTSKLEKLFDKATRLR